MLFSHDEYAAMFEVEERLWWYKILHEKIEAVVANHFSDKNVRILDAGCGTGGLLNYLMLSGYSNLSGFDYAESAVLFSKKRGLKVHKMSIEEIGEHYSHQEFDVIICNDVFYSLENHQISKALSDISTILSDKGVFVSNNNAYSIFYGIHDFVLGGKQRFTINDFKQLQRKSGLAIDQYTYWSFLLSPLILAVRLFQQLKMKVIKIDKENTSSDVEMPATWVNALLFNLVKLEGRVFKSAPFGSSLFKVFKKADI